jgi:ferric-dicitrate binding protein FerR (iron transport regulator)
MRAQKRLPDGTIVHLNADSKVVMADGFLKKNRFVYLTGEAYFEVSHADKDMPFIVYTDGFVTIANGKSSFDIKDYPEQKKVLLSVKQGTPNVTKLKMSDKRAPDTIPMIKLRPARKVKSSHVIAYDKSNSSFKPMAKESVKTNINWQNGILSFNNAGLPKVLHKIERWYGVNIKTKGFSNIKEHRFSGNFKEAKLKQVLLSLSKKMDVHFSIDGSTILLSKRC